MQQEAVRNLVWRGLVLGTSIHLSSLKRVVCICWIEGARETLSSQNFEDEGLQLAI